MKLQPTIQNRPSMKVIRCYFYSLLSHLILISVLLQPNPAYAELKVLERSADKLPEWIKLHTQDYLLPYAEGTSLNEARRLLEQELLRQVASAVAIHVEGTTVTDAGVNGDHEWDTYHNYLTASIARLPFITDITLAKCKDIYWDHVIEKNSGKECYRMTALYPFDAKTRERLISQYEAFDYDLERALVEIEERWKTINSSADISTAESQLEALSQSFIDSNRIKRCQNALELYGKIRNSLSLEGTILSEGLCHVRVLRGNTLFHTEGRINVSSECASDIKVTKNSEGWSIQFNNEDCLKDEANSLKITLRDNGIRLKTEVSF